MGSKRGAAAELMSGGAEPARVVRRIAPGGAPADARRRGGPSTEHVAAEACVLVLFGATGDLARTALLPSLLELEGRECLSESTVVIGCARRDWTAEEYRRAMAAELPRGHDAAAWERLASRMSYCRIDLTDAAAYARLAEQIAEARSSRDTPDNVLFHLATPPAHFPTVVSNLEAEGLSRSDGGWRRIVIEKPFGRDRASARELEEAVGRAFGEEQVYRIDHFLGKEAVQNLLVFRFANPGFEPIWNRAYVEYVRVLAAEEEGIGTRGSFYEDTGAVRDMVQNHLLQLLCAVAMEPPTRFDAGSFRDEAAKVLDALRPLDVQEDAVRGQYGAGRVRDAAVVGYREEEDVAPDSAVETYAAVRAFVDNWRWAGVPFYLETGKRLERKVTEVEVRFKPTPHLMFAPECRDGSGNALVFRITPDAGVRQTIATKRPGPSVEIAKHRMELSFADVFEESRLLSAYASLLHDAMQGDQTLFARRDWVDRAWRWIDPLVQAWGAAPPLHFPNYEAGSWGPPEVEDVVPPAARRGDGAGSSPCE